MKKLIAFIVAACLLSTAALAACNGNGSDSTSTSDTLGGGEQLSEESVAGKSYTLMDLGTCNYEYAAYTGTELEEFIKEMQSTGSGITVTINFYSEEITLTSEQIEEAFCYDDTDSFPENVNGDMYSNGAKAYYLICVQDGSTISVYDGALKDGVAYSGVLAEDHTLWATFTSYGDYLEGRLLVQGDNNGGVWATGTWDLVTE